MPDPQPVQPLEYDSDPIHPLSRVLRHGVGIVLMAFGALHSIGIVSGFVGYPRLEPRTWVGIVALIAAIMAMIAGLACILQWRQTRTIMIVFVFVDMGWRVAISAINFIQFGMDRPDGMSGKVSQIAYSMTSLAFPAIVYVIARQRALWAGTASGNSPFG